MTGLELAQWRVGHDYTQQELADVLGVSRRTVLNWEESHTAMPGYVKLALKGLLFSHGGGYCRCAQCGFRPNRVMASGVVRDPSYRVVGE